jgi:LysM repeat protein
MPRPTASLLSAFIALALSAPSCSPPPTDPDGLESDLSVAVVLALLESLPDLDPPSPRVHIVVLGDTMKTPSPSFLRRLAELPQATFVSADEVVIRPDDKLPIHLSTELSPVTFQVASLTRGAEGKFLARAGWAYKRQMLRGEFAVERADDGTASARLIRWDEARDEDGEPATPPSS